MDFVSDRPFDGRPFRILSLVDRPRGEALTTSSRPNPWACPGIEESDRLAITRGKPRSVRVENDRGDYGPPVGPRRRRDESAGRPVNQWAYLNKVELDVLRPGRPSNTALLEAFNRRLGQECLNAAWFLSTADARHRIVVSGMDPTDHGMHPALGNLDPSAFAALLKSTRKLA